MSAVGTSGELEEHRLVLAGCIQLVNISGACSTGEFRSAIEVTRRVPSHSRSRECAVRAVERKKGRKALRLKGWSNPAPSDQKRNQKKDRLPSSCELHSCLLFH